MAPSSAFLGRLKAADPDRYFCTLFAPPETREGLALLYLFNHELARAREVASEPILARIRLQWWREVVEGAEKKHELATPLAACLAAGMFARADLLRLIEAREMAAEAEIPDREKFMDYARGTGGWLARVAGRYLGADSDAVEDAGTAYAVAGILRNERFVRPGRSLLPADGSGAEALVTAGRKLLGASIPRVALPAALPAAFARRDFRARARRRNGRDRARVVLAALTGRV